MINIFLRPLLALIAGLLYVFNVIFWGIIIFTVAILLLIPNEKIRAQVHKALHYFPILWSKSNDLIMKLTTRIDWQVTGMEKLHRDHWYLLVSNHQSWVDILVLQKIFNQKIPFTKFFMKKELLWQLPIAAQICWLLDFPFMERYSKSYLQKHPEKKGKDFETTKKACQKFKKTPTTVVNFIEGGRFKIEKYRLQQSPYQHLLKPKAGGAAFILHAMEGMIKEMINVTIIYPEPISFYRFLSGQVHKIIVKIDVIPIPVELIGDYENDRVFRAQFQAWLNQLWLEKDNLITQVLQENNGNYSRS